jgi:type I restriction enzyme S subunit
LRYLDEQTSRSENLIAEAEKQVNLLKERRSALISAAVTGQIDVRGLAPDASAA